MKTSNELNKILPKLAKALKELGGVKKSSNNPFFKSKYADLNTHLDVAESALESQGLILLQPVDRDERGSYVESIVLDPESAQFISSRMDLVLAKVTMQDVGSAVTYGRRYTLGALLSMQALDDDSEGAMGRGKAVQQAATPVPSAAKRASFRGPKAVPTAVSTEEVANTTTEVVEGWE